MEAEAPPKETPLNTVAPPAAGETPDDLVARGLACHQEGRFAEAERLYRQALTRAPEHPDALHLWGLVARRTGRNRLAVHLLRQAIASQPAFADAHYNLGNALRGVDAAEAALHAYHQALVLAPAHTGARKAMTRLAEGGDLLAELAAHLDGEYRSGRWAYLAGLHEVARYGIVAGWLRRVMAGRPQPGRVLDLGCGTGNLLPHLVGCRVSGYVGVDISAAALAASPVQGKGIQRVCSPIERYAPEAGAVFDLIIFNEVLTYIDDPFTVVGRYRDWLAPDGMMIVSWFREPGLDEGVNLSLLKEQGFWTALDTGDWATLDQVRLNSESCNLEWRLRLIRPALRACTQ